MPLPSVPTDDGVPRPFSGGEPAFQTGRKTSWQAQISRNVCRLVLLRSAVTRLQLGIAFSILALGFATARGQDHIDPPSAPHQTARRSQGFLDYALGKINPANRDYGLSAADLRAEVVHDSIDDLYFWSNLVTLSLLATITAIRVLEHRA